MSGCQQMEASANCLRAQAVKNIVMQLGAVMLVATDRQDWDIHAVPFRQVRPLRSVPIAISGVSNPSLAYAPYTGRSALTVVNWPPNRVTVSFMPPATHESAAE